MAENFLDLNTSYSGCVCGDPPFQGKDFCGACKFILPLVEAHELAGSFDDPVYRINPEIIFILDEIRVRLRHALGAIGHPLGKRPVVH